MVEFQFAEERRRRGNGVSPAVVQSLLAATGHRRRLVREHAGQPSVRGAPKGSLGIPFDCVPLRLGSGASAPQCAPATRILQATTPTLYVGNRDRLRISYGSGRPECERFAAARNRHGELIRESARCFRHRDSERNDLDVAASFRKLYLE